MIANPRVFEIARRGFESLCYPGGAGDRCHHLFLGRRCFSRCGAAIRRGHFAKVLVFVRRAFGREAEDDDDEADLCHVATAATVGRGGRGGRGHVALGEAGEEWRVSMFFCGEVRGVDRARLQRTDVLARRRPPGRRRSLRPTTTGPRAALAAAAAVVKTRGRECTVRRVPWA